MNLLTACTCPSPADAHGRHCAFAGTIHSFQTNEMTTDDTSHTTVAQACKLSTPWITKQCSIGQSLTLSMRQSHLEGSVQIFHSDGTISVGDTCIVCCDCTMASCNATICGKPCNTVNVPMSPAVTPHCRQCKLLILMLCACSLTDRAVKTLQQALVDSCPALQADRPRKLLCGTSWSSTRQTQKFHHAHILSDGIPHLANDT